MEKAMAASSSQPETMKAECSLNDLKACYSESSDPVLHVTLLGGEWGSSAGGLSTINRELAIHLSNHSAVKVSLLVPEGACNTEEIREADGYGITIVEVKERAAFDRLDWLSSPPKDHVMDIVVGHGVKLGRQVQFIRDSARFPNCKWVQVVHTAPEDLSRYKCYSDPISKGETKHESEVELCKLADLVVPVGPRLKEAYTSYLQRYKTGQDVLSITPGLFQREFGDLIQTRNEHAEFKVLLFGRGDDEDFELKGYNIAAQAFTDRRLKNKPYHLIFVGAPEGKQEKVREKLLQREIAEAQLTVRKFLQSREKLKDLLCEADLAIMPSKSEGFGLVALEALSAGLPILVGSKSGFAIALDNVLHGNACIVNSDDPAEWAKAIEAVRIRHGMRLQEIKWLREFYEKMYSWKEQCEALVNRMWKMSHEDSLKARSSLETKCNVSQRMEGMTEDHKEPSIEIYNNQRTNSYDGKQLVSETSLSSACETKADAASGYQTKISMDTDSQSQSSRELKMSIFSCNPGLSLKDVAGNMFALLNKIQEQVCSAISALHSGKDLLSIKKNVQYVLEQVNKNLDLIKASCKEEASSWLRSTGRVSQKELASWERLGEGRFSSVYKAKLKGSDVAVKVLKNLKETKPLLTEGNLLRDLRHDNIVAFRGMNILQSDIVHEKFTLKAGTPFLVMEYIPKNLYRFVEDHKTPESQGLPRSQVWTIGRGMANGLMYLHGLNPPISHRDLKPDNILLDVRSLRVKLADFGLSRTVERTGNDLSLFHARWTAPEVWEDYRYFGEEPIEENEALEFFLRADIYSYGQVVAYTLTGKMPWHGQNTVSVAGIQNNMIQSLDQVEIPEELSGKLRSVIHDCRLEDPKERPTADRLVQDYFKGDMNPYQAEAKSAEFFSCGFLQHTSIFVAESLVDESSEGFFKTGVRPQGFPAQCLLCKVEVGNEEYNNVPKEWTYEQKYREYYGHFKQKDIDKTIGHLYSIALKSLITSRDEEQERQEIQLSFGQTTYCHHRAVREIWRKLEESKKRELVVCKNTVHPVFSTSFGLHVAVLTADKPQKFIFTRRSNQEGVPSPGKFTCGAVESASVKDYVHKNGQAYVDLVKTAVRGLKEELRVELKGSDIEALCLTTIYLKFDTHEWGCCGYVDLSDPRVSPERRLTYEQIESRFTSGPKDKFKHANLVALDFELSGMVEFVRDNYEDFASSAKLVVVKVLQSFFGVAAVERAFRVYMEDRESVSQNADSQI